MRRLGRSVGLAALISAAAAVALADAPSRSLVPLARGAVEAPPTIVRAEVAAASARAPRLSLRPMPRGRAVQASSRAATATGLVATAAASALALASDVPAPATTRPAAIAGIAAMLDRSPRPAGRPGTTEGATRTAAAGRVAPGGVSQPGTRGALCGIPGLSGDRIQPVTGHISGCGIAEPIRLRSVDGIALSAPATINCDAARALTQWVRQGLVPSVGRTGGGVDSLRVVATYSCRTRNSQRGARLSEHARGNAIDIAGIGLSDGSELTVLSDWGSGREGRILRELHQSACGPFGTVLGPNSDRFHRDHFHFDVASYRSGSYCR